MHGEGLFRFDLLKLNQTIDKRPFRPLQGVQIAHDDQKLARRPTISQFHDPHTQCSPITPRRSDRNDRDSGSMLHHAADVFKGPHARTEIEILPREQRLLAEIFRERAARAQADEIFPDHVPERDLALAAQCMVTRDDQPEFLGGERKRLQRSGLHGVGHDTDFRRAVEHRLDGFSALPLLHIDVNIRVIAKKLG